MHRFASLRLVARSLEVMWKGKETRKPEEGSEVKAVKASNMENNDVGRGVARSLEEGGQQKPGKKPSKVLGESIPQTAGVQSLTPLKYS